MASTNSSETVGVSSLLSDYSVEMTGKDDKTIEEHPDIYAPRTRVNVTFLSNEDMNMRVTASRAVKEAGYVPVPHISARRLRTEDELTEFLEALAAVDATDSVFAVGGDPSSPMGPYEDSLTLIRSGQLQRYGVRHVSISGYPEGHPDISDHVLRKALREKIAALADNGLAGSIITQFGFDVDPVVTWLTELRDSGIDLPVRVGVPGPAGIKRLLSYAKRFGVASSAGVAQKYGFSLSNLLGTAGPDRFIRQLAEEVRHEKHGPVKLHFYTFGGLKATGEWIRDFQQAVS